jgi:hypothetical protein
MTFTEAAVEVLRLIGKPLHYKKITELAIERNLLSHVGKTPEITMSSRLATMVKKDRGDAPIVKVKPGVFGLREFSESVLEAAESESGHDFDLPEEPEVEEVAAEAEGQEAAERPRALPGADVFPEEEDDDEPILGRLDRDDGADGPAGGRARKRRRRKRKGPGEREGGERKAAPEPRAGRREPPSRPAARSAARVERVELTGDWDRTAAEGDATGQDLADAIFAVLSGAGRGVMSHADVAAQLVRRGRLSGDAAALAPTVAAAVWGDDAKRRGDVRRLRFRTTSAGIGLTDWDLPADALRAEQEAWRAAERQRDTVHRAFLRRLSDMPAAAFMELVAAWLNAEGVVALRGVRPPSKGGYHLAGTLRRGGQETGVAVAVWRDGTLVGREHVIEVRGALHHYGNASAAWLVTTGRVQSGAREEAAAAGRSPCMLVDGGALALAMERMGIGLTRVHVPLSLPDFDLLDRLSPSVPRTRTPVTQSPGEGPPPDDGAEAKPDDEQAERPAKRRRRRRGGSGERTEERGDAASDETADERSDATSEETADEQAADVERAAEHEHEDEQEKVQEQDAAAESPAAEQPSSEPAADEAAEITTKTDD